MLGYRPGAISCFLDFQTSFQLFSKLQWFMRHLAKLAYLFTGTLVKWAGYNAVKDKQNKMVSL
jgi:hypothetical protein